jgi:3-methyladenine DNA glycosylase Tag
MEESTVALDLAGEARLTDGFTRGYLSQALFEQLFRAYDLQLITPLKSNMKNRLMLWSDKLLLRKRAILETLIDQLKNISQIEHTRHRSLANFMVNLVAGLIAYCHRARYPVKYHPNVLAD